MNNYNLLLKEVIDGFQKLHGVATINIPKTINNSKIVYEVITRFHLKHPSDRVLIVVEDYQTRVSIRKLFEDKDENIEYIHILGKDYIKTEHIHHYSLAITVGVNENINLLLDIKRKCKFVLCIITANHYDNDFNITLYKTFPTINTSITFNDLISENIYCPVEERIISTSLSDKDRELYDKYTNFINECVSIYGDISTIEQCRNGNPKLSISAVSIRESIARDNNWSPTLDTSKEYNKLIDSIYNPNALLERANVFYNIIKERRDLVSDNDSKLEAIKDLIIANSDKRILIVSKRSFFAATITKYLKANNINCLDYHDCIENAYDYDEYGKIVVYKSGSNKGEPKLIKAQAQSTKNLNRYNNKECNILSIKNTSNNDIVLDCDIIIFTSAFCEEIYTFKKRFLGLTINSNPNIIYTIILKNTIERKRLNEREHNMLHTIIDDASDDIVFDENNNNIVVDI